MNEALLDHLGQARREQLELHSMFARCLLWQSPHAGTPALEYRVGINGKRERYSTHPSEIRKLSCLLIDVNCLQLHFTKGERLQFLLSALVGCPCGCQGIHFCLEGLSIQHSFLPKRHWGYSWGVRTRTSSRNRGRGPARKSCCGESRANRAGFRSPAGDGCVERLVRTGCRRGRTPATTPTAARSRRCRTWRGREDHEFGFNGFETIIGLPRHSTGGNFR